MKKTLWVVALSSMLAVGVALLVHASSTESGAKSSTTSSASSTAALQQKLEALERKTWDAFKSQDMKAIKEVIAPDGLSADMNGFATADQMDSMIKDYTLESCDIQDVKLVKLDKDAAVLVYTATVSAKFRGESVPSGPYYVSTVYANRGGKWMGVYHQETLAMSGMPGASATTH